MSGRVTAAIVQARLASTRLPGKVLLPLAGRTVIEHVLHRCSSIPGVDVVVCAVPESAECDVLAAEASRCGAMVFRGSELDVLDRYFRAARSVCANIIMRVTSDCPLIDPEVCGQVLALRERAGADYACNNMPASWPHGLDCESFTMEALECAAREARLPFEREHVTPWIRTQDRFSRVNLACPYEGMSGWRWTLDYPEDFGFMNAAFKNLAAWPAIPCLDAVVALLKARPDIAAINASRTDPSRLASQIQI